MADPKVALAALAREKGKRRATREQNLEIIRRLLVPAAAKCVRVTTLRRLLRICGLAITVPETLDLLMEVFPDVSFSRDPKDQSKRAYTGIRVRPGFSAVTLGAALKRKYEQAINPVGAVAEYETILAEEGMPADINDVPDPAGPDRRELPHSYDGDDEFACAGDHYSGMPTKRIGAGPLSRWPTRSSPDDPSISPDIAHVRSGLAELAYRIPGFFNGVLGPQYELMWRLVRIEGMTHPTVGKIVKRPAAYVRTSVRNTETRLMRHLKALGEPNVKRLFDIDNPISVRRGPERYLFANTWHDETERKIFEKATFEKAHPDDIANELSMDPKVVAKILRKHRIRARLPLESL